MCSALVCQSEESGDFFSQRFSAAFLAISLRRSGDKASLRALPPLSPPSRPSVTAAAFLLGSGGSSLGISPIAFCTTSQAIWLKSFGPWPRLVDLFGTQSKVTHLGKIVNHAQA